MAENGTPTATNGNVTVGANTNALHPGAVTVAKMQAAKAGEPASATPQESKPSQEDGESANVLRSNSESDLTAIDSAAEDVASTETRESLLAAERIAAMEAEVEKLRQERDSAKRHASQREQEYRKLRKASLTDPELIAEMEAEQAEIEAEAARRDQEFQARQEEMQREFAIKGNRLDVRQSFIDVGVSADDSVKLAEWITTEDADESALRAAGIASVIKKAAKAASKQREKAMLADNAKEPPNGVDANSGDKPVSRGAQQALRYMQQAKSL